MQSNAVHSMSETDSSLRHSEDLTTLFHPIGFKRTLQFRPDFATNVFEFCETETYSYEAHRRFLCVVVRFSTSAICARDLQKHSASEKTGRQDKGLLVPVL